MNDKILDPNKVRAKKMMLLFALLSITMTFAGLTSAYIVSKGRPDWLVDFELPILFFYSTILLVISSITIQLAKYNLINNKSKKKCINVAVPHLNIRVFILHLTIFIF
jgi:cytochrome c oxidase subunit 3